jgi:hypothetical protein
MREFRHRFRRSAGTPAPVPRDADNWARRRMAGITSSRPPNARLPIPRGRRRMAGSSRGHVIRAEMDPSSSGAFPAADRCVLDRYGGRPDFWRAFLQFACLAAKYRNVPNGMKLSRNVLFQ